MRIIFLDRDGVINRFPGKGLYVTRPEDFQLLPRAAQAIARLTKAGCEIYVVSNQGCVSRGLITEKILAQMTETMMSEIRAAGGQIQKVYYCPHQTSDHCECKKPKLKFFREVIAGRAVDMKNVYFVGDSAEDMEAAKGLGCRGVLVLSGRTTDIDAPGFEPKPETIQKDLWEAVEWILQKRS